METQEKLERLVDRKVIVYAGDYNQRALTVTIGKLSFGKIRGFQVYTEGNNGRVYFNQADVKNILHFNAVLPEIYLH